MPKVVCNTSPVQYLHQLGLLHALPLFSEQEILFPPAVFLEIDAGHAAKVDLPNLREVPWALMRVPQGCLEPALVIGLGAGEREAIALAVETPESVLILDDRLARRVANALGLRITGTLGVILDAKAKAIIPSVKPVLAHLNELDFRCANDTYQAILRAAGES